MIYPWENSRRFNAYSDYIKKSFGCRIQKLSIDAGFTCPNRDGTKGTGGCTFCINDAFNPSYCKPDKPLSIQIKEGIIFHEQRYRKTSKYMAYFQAYSNTYAPIDKLKSVYEEVLGFDQVIGIAIGTRPDCVNDEILSYLGSLALNHYVIIEYGIESVYNSTLQRVNRCHTFEDTIRAINNTAERGISVGGHMIFGLPGECPDAMTQSAAILSELPLNSLKFHQLQIFKGTQMEQEFQNDPSAFYQFSEEEYLDFMVEYISRLNPKFSIERIAGETPPRFAATKPWGPRYDQILVKFEKLLEKKDQWQGKNFKPKC
jgi:uncharacterized protein